MVYEQIMDEMGDFMSEVFPFVKQNERRHRSCEYFLELYIIHEVLNDLLTYFETKIQYRNFMNFSLKLYYLNTYIKFRTFN